MGPREDSRVQREDNGKSQDTYDEWQTPLEYRCEAGSNLQDGTQLTNETRDDVSPLYVNYQLAVSCLRTQQLQLGRVL